MRGSSASMAEVARSSDSEVWAPVQRDGGLRVVPPQSAPTSRRLRLAPGRDTPDHEAPADHEEPAGSPAAALEDDDVPADEPSRSGADALLAAAAATGARRSRGVDRRSVVALSADVAVLVLAGVALSAPLALVVLSGAALFAVRVPAGLYRRRLGLSVLDEMPRGLQSTVLALGATSLVLTVGGRSDLLGTATLLLASFLACSAVLRTALYAAMRRRLRRDPSARRRTLVIGAGAVGVELVQAMRQHPEQGLEPVGFVDGQRRGEQVALSVPLLVDDETRLHEVLESHRVDTVVIAYGSAPERSIVDSVIAAVRHGCEVLVVPRLFELQHDGPDVESVRGLPLVRLRTDVRASPAWLVKAFVDRAVAAAALLVLAPALLAVAVTVLVDGGRPVLFRQERVGLWSRPITVLKFRSMRPASEAEQQTTWNIAQDSRVSPIGRFLRTFSLDELPQLLNVLRGDMSLVGPRPERPAFVAQFSRDHERYWARHRVPVGLTGWSQVNGLRGDTSIQDRARYDNYYIANWSLWLDVKILLLTLREVVRGGGG